MVACMNRMAPASVLVRGGILNMGGGRRFLTSGCSGLGLNAMILSSVMGFICFDVSPYISGIERTKNPTCDGFSVFCHFRTYPL